MWRKLVHRFFKPRTHARADEAREKLFARRFSALLPLARPRVACPVNNNVFILNIQRVNNVRFLVGDSVEGGCHEGADRREHGPRNHLLAVQGMFLVGMPAFIRIVGNRFGGWSGRLGVPYMKPSHVDQLCACCHGRRNL